MAARSAQAAFTLIEVLVAVLILGIVSAMVLISLNSSDLRHMETDAQLLQSWVDDLRDRAILYGGVFGVYLDQGRPRAAQWYDQRWWPGLSEQQPALSEALQFEFPDLEPDQSAQMRTDEQTPPIVPGLVVMPDGSLLAESSLMIRTPAGAALKLTWTQAGLSPQTEVQ